MDSNVNVVEMIKNRNGAKDKVIANIKVQSVQQYEACVLNTQMGFMESQDSITVGDCEMFQKSSGYCWTG